MSDDDNTNGTFEDHDDEKKRKDTVPGLGPRSKARNAATVIVNPKAPELFEFLDGLWLERGREEGWPQRVVLHSIRNAGATLGPQIREVNFSYKSRPDKEALVELSNMLLRLAQLEADSLAKPQVFAVVAYDDARGDHYYARCVLRLRPSGINAAVYDERGAAEDEEEGRAKLLERLLEEERRHSRWALEMAMNVASGALENSNARIDRMEQIVDGSWKRQTEMMKATEEMLNQAADRKAKTEWARWKQEKITLGLDKAFALAEHLLPALAAKHLASVVMEPNPVRTFLETLNEEEGTIAFGKIVDGQRVAPGFFSVAQGDLFLAIAKSAKVEDAQVMELVSSITPEQMESCKRLFGIERLLPLVSWFQSRSQASTQ